MNLDSRYAVQAGIRFRYEDFGGIVYRRSDDRLYILNSHLAVDLLYGAGTGKVRDIAAKAGADLPNQQAAGEHILKLLGYLEELGLVYELEH
ncbi:MAG: mycofactocin biosynthesis chaperone MftB [Clostridia bacterium]|nr:mycofactocin biosynthesis chaperone MftB [Clostridia bacterium]